MGQGRITSSCDVTWHFLWVYKLNIYCIVKPVQLDIAIYICMKNNKKICTSRIEVRRLNQICFMCLGEWQPELPPYILHTRSFILLPFRIQACFYCNTRNRAVCKKLKELSWQYVGMCIRTIKGNTFRYKSVDVTVKASMFLKFHRPFIKSCILCWSYLHFKICINILNTWALRRKGKMLSSLHTVLWLLFSVGCSFPREIKIKLLDVFNDFPSHILY